ncbi:hypothetical protein AC477_03110 [miscellaneous Crenarchaeota group-1 archaeon SG8-32-1]|uniref:DUF5320 domain-containing protein n=1 Tax=miscellaneous Crenarchaeota group-1 archaeon SG8-32-1 TaxID=1685124 RepID=A0A0M0BUQ2_9ARCH|nr:MAG: hypothetical protein AC477_03110 [miscellaneous Crenarchaeota group-1 archaeon SG8-32-1]
MPTGDKTGPIGQGPMTGRAAGYCAGYSVPGFMNPINGYGKGFGRGCGRGWGRRFGRERFVYPQPVAVQPAYQNVYPPLAQTKSPRQEIAELENYKLSLDVQKGDLERELDDVTARIEELQKTILRKNDQ